MGVAAVDRILQYLRHGSRSLSRQWPAATLATLVIMIGVGPNIALFSAVNAVLLRSLPFREPERLVVIHQTRPDIPVFPASFPDFKDWDEQNVSFEGMAAYSLPSDRSVLIHQGEPTRISRALVSGNYFPLTGIPILHGRSFRPDDDRPGFDGVAILSHRLWENYFSADPAVLDSGIEIDGESFQIVGVVNRQQFPADVDIFLPLSQLGEEDLNSRARRRVWGIGRLGQGVTQDESASDLELISRRLEDAYPRLNRDVRAVQYDLLEYYTGDVDTTLLVLLGASGLVLLIACTNVANLLLVGGARRRSEVAIRCAVGASPRRIFGERLVESMMLATAGTAGGFVLAIVGFEFVSKWVLGVANIPRLDQASIDPAVALYTVWVVGLTGILFGTLPASAAVRVDLNESLKAGGRETSAAAPRRLSRLLIVGQVAIAVVVLIGTGLLFRSMAFLSSVDPGMRTDDVLAVELSLPRQRYATPEAMNAFYDEVLERIEGLPGVSGVATTSVLPFTPSLSVMHFGVAGEPVADDGQYPTAEIRTVSHDYFEVMGIAIERGRDFERGDSPQTGFIINQTMARRFLGSVDAATNGALIPVEVPGAEAVPILGIAADVQDLGVDRPAEAEMYTLGHWFDSAVLVWVESDASALIHAIRDVVRSVDPFQPIGQIRSMGEVLEASLAHQRVLTLLMLSFSGLALILTSVGIYGVVSRLVIDQKPEIGVRMALGASRRKIAGSVARQALLPVVLGAVGGMVGAWSFQQVLAEFLYGVSAADPATYAGVGLLVATMAALAIGIPAGRASRVDPNIVLRHR